MKVQPVQVLPDHCASTHFSAGDRSASGTGMHVYDGQAGTDHQTSKGGEERKRRYAGVHEGHVSYGSDTTLHQIPSSQHPGGDVSRIWASSKHISWASGLTSRNADAGRHPTH